MTTTTTTTTTDPAAERFYALVWPHAQTVLRTARLICRNDTEADDLTQDTLLKAYRRVGALREPGRARPWLMAILRHAHVDRARVRRRPALSLDELDFDPAGPEERAWRVPDAPRADPDLALDEFSDRDVIAALRQLPRDVRWTLLLVDVEGMSDAEAAGALRIPVGTVKSRLHRGRGMLRDALCGVAKNLRIAG